MKWLKGAPKASGTYLVRFIYGSGDDIYKEVGIGKYNIKSGWLSVEDEDGWWSGGGSPNVTGWMPLPKYEEDVA